MKIILLEAKIITLEAGALAHCRNEVISQHIADGVPADAAIQALGMRLARQVRYADLARVTGVRQPQPDHSHIDG
jgi:hypothetical protein